MSRYIDADLLLAQCRRNPLFEKTKEDKRMIYIERSIIDATPTADVVEVVRCKDCKHHPDNGGECDRSITHTGRDYVCEVNTYRYIGIDYCSYGERKEG